eukprot:2351487-Rhodomonas_salina.1
MDGGRREDEECNRDKPEALVIPALHPTQWHEDPTRVRGRQYPVHFDHRSLSAPDRGNAHHCCTRAILAPHRDPLPTGGRGWKSPLNCQDDTVQRSQKRLSDYPGTVTLMTVTGTTCSGGIEGLGGRSAGVVA